MSYVYVRTYCRCCALNAKHSIPDFGCIRSRTTVFIHLRHDSGIWTRVQVVPITQDGRRYWSLTSVVQRVEYIRALVQDPRRVQRYDGDVLWSDQESRTRWTPFFIRYYADDTCTVLYCML